MEKRKRKGGGGAIIVITQRVTPDHFTTTIPHP
jgi:hypothetical protein